MNIGRYHRIKPMQASNIVAVVDSLVPNNQLCSPWQPLSTSLYCYQAYTINPGYIELLPLPEMQKDNFFTRAWFEPK